MKLTVARGEGKGRIFTLEEGNNVLGRWDPDAGAFPEVDLTKVDVEAKISRKHAQIVVKDANEAYLEDLGSLNGTYVNRGARLEKSAPHKLADGDEIVVGKTFLVFNS